MKRGILVIILAVTVIEIQACRYTIREIGYSNLLLEDYQLTLEADSAKHKELIHDFLSLAFAHSVDANFHYNYIQTKITSPNLSFLSGKKKQLFSQTVKSTNDIINSLDYCLYSPSQKELAEKINRSFAVILYFEEKSGAKKEILNTIAKAVKEFKNVAPYLDRAVSEDIPVIQIPFEKRISNEIILKTLDAKNDHTGKMVAIIFGKGRLAGDPLVNEKLTSDNILNKLLLLGTDCECGIDLSPILERALPLHWSKELRQETAEMLGFDSDNPMVLAEMSTILQKGSSRDESSASLFMPDMFFLKQKTVEKSEIKSNDPYSKTLSMTVITLISIILIVISSTVLIFYRKR
jgi:hypothetical protein